SRLVSSINKKFVKMAFHIFAKILLNTEKLAFEHRLPRGRKPAVSLRVTRNKFKKQLLMFVVYCFF
ncbi:hypothetical protein, partial [Enterococcus faecium]|uniref:hypothetical protein n=1 Tax=Enterococcus faecium TaxID=1352 RepID=UPI0035E027E7